MRWLWYSLGGSVPAKNRTWVLHDVTCSTWILRHLVRYFVLSTPFVVAVLLFLPAPLSLRIESSFAAAGSLLIGYMCFTTESLEHRAEKAGYPYGTASALRERRANETQHAMAARNRARREDRR